MFSSFLGRYYGEGEAVPVVPPVSPPPPPPATPPVGKVFTQDEVNAMMADHKRNLQAKIAELSKTAGNAEQMAQKVKELNNTLLTKEELAKQEADALKSDYETKLKAEADARTAWEARYKDQTFDVALGKAASKHDAFDSEQLGLLIKGNSSVKEVTDKAGNPTGKFVVETKVVVDGKELTLPIDEAIGKLRDSGRYPNQFKVKGSPGTGITLNNNPGGTTGDPKDVPSDPAKFMEWYQAQLKSGTVRQ